MHFGIVAWPYAEPAEVPACTTVPANGWWHGSFPAQVAGQVTTSGADFAASQSPCDRAAQQWTVRGCFAVWAACRASSEFASHGRLCGHAPDSVGQQ